VVASRFCAVLERSRQSMVVVGRFYANLECFRQSVVLSAIRLVGDLALSAGSGVADSILVWCGQCGVAAVGSGMVW
jgi:hypothetical protein